jgi:hypothetical protein
MEMESRQKANRQKRKDKRGESKCQESTKLLLPRGGGSGSPTPLLFFNACSVHHKETTEKGIFSNFTTI